MKTLPIILLAILASACGRKTEAEGIAAMIKSCPPGGTATISLTAATFANSATATCTWVQPAHEADHSTTKQETDQ